MKKVFKAKLKFFEIIVKLKILQQLQKTILTFQMKSNKMRAILINLILTNSIRVEALKSVATQDLVVQEQGVNFALWTSPKADQDAEDFVVASDMLKRLGNPDPDFFLKKALPLLPHQPPKPTHKNEYIVSDENHPEDVKVQEGTTSNSPPKSEWVPPNDREMEDDIKVGGQPIRYMEVKFRGELLVNGHFLQSEFDAKKFELKERFPDDWSDMEQKLDACWHSQMSPLDGVQNEDDLIEEAKKMRIKFHPDKYRQRMLQEWKRMKKEYENMSLSQEEIETEWQNYEKNMEHEMTKVTAISQAIEKIQERRQTQLADAKRAKADARAGLEEDDDDDNASSNWICDDCGTQNALSKLKCKHCPRIPTEDQSLAKVTANWRQHCENLLRRFFEDFMEQFGKHMDKNHQENWIKFIMMVRGYDLDFERTWGDFLRTYFKSKSSPDVPSSRSPNSEFFVRQRGWTSDLKALLGPSDVADPNDGLRAETKVWARSTSPNMRQQLGGSCWMNSFASQCRAALGLSFTSSFRNKLVTLLRVGRVRQTEAIDFINKHILFDAPTKLQERRISTMEAFQSAFDNQDPMRVAGAGIEVRGDSANGNHMTLAGHSVLVDYLSSNGEWIVLKNTWGDREGTNFSRLHLTRSELESYFDQKRSFQIHSVTSISQVDLLAVGLESRVDFLIDCLEKMSSFPQPSDPAMFDFYSFIPDEELLDEDALWYYMYNFCRYHPARQRAKFVADMPQNRDADIEAWYTDNFIRLLSHHFLGTGLPVPDANLIQQHKQHLDQSLVLVDDGCVGEDFLCPAENEDSMIQESNSTNSQVEEFPERVPIAISQEVSRFCSSIGVTSFSYQQMNRNILGVSWFLSNTDSQSSNGARRKKGTKLMKEKFSSIVYEKDGSFWEVRVMDTFMGKRHPQTPIHFVRVDDCARGQVFLNPGKNKFIKTLDADFLNDDDSSDEISAWEGCPAENEDSMIQESNTNSQVGKNMTF